MISPIVVAFVKKKEKKTRSILTKVTRNIIAMHAGIAPDLIKPSLPFAEKHWVKDTTEATDLNQSNENH